MDKLILKQYLKEKKRNIGERRDCKEIEGSLR